MLPSPPSPFTPLGGRPCSWQGDERAHPDPLDLVCGLQIVASVGRKFQLSDFGREILEKIAMNRDQINPSRDQSPNLTSMNPLSYQFMAEDALLGMGMQQQQLLLPSAGIRHMDWSPDTMLDNLTFIEEKIRQVKDVIRAMAGRSSAPPGELAAQQQQQLVNADLTCLIVQLISTAGSLLPSLKNSSFLSRTPPAAGAGQAVSVAGESSSSVRNEVNKGEEMGSPDYEELFKGWTNGSMEECIGGGGVLAGEEQDAKVDAGVLDVENLPPPGSYQVLQLEEDEILAPHTHFCSICGKGFKRDANLRMHMRGHGDEYKSAAALAKPPPSAAAGEEQERRYSCPFAGCKRNRLHKSFQPLKTILCVKNHYKRSHCEKRHTCGRCGAKKFSVMADLKTHEKHCGRDRWLCSCGTSFSRKDKLFAHVALFQGHTPALPPPTTTQAAAAAEPATTARASAPSSGHQQEPAGAASFMWGTSSSCDGDADALLDVKGIAGAGAGGDDFFSTNNFGDFGFGQLDAFGGDPSLAMLLPSEQFTNVQESEEK